VTPYTAFVFLGSLLLAAAQAAIDNRGRRERLYLSARVFLGCVLTVWGGSWMMRLIHG